MIEKKVYTIYIDTKIDKNQNPNKFKVKLSNWFMRNNIKNGDNSINEWFISIKSLALLNSFSNITKNINDTIILYVAKDNTKPELDINTNLTDYNQYTFTFPAGNPNVQDIEDKLNAFFLTHNLQCVYDSYDSKYTFTEITLSDIKKSVFFGNTHTLLGFNDNQYYHINNTTKKEFRSDRNVNLLADRLIKFNIDTISSDFRIKNINYCNHMNNEFFSDCQMFHLQAVNVNPYDLIYYERFTENLIPIQLHKNSITDFTINTTNQDGDYLEGLSDYIMVLDFVHIKKWHFEYKIYKLVHSIYLWIANYLFKRI